MQNKRCTRCIIDTTVPGVIFDENGICNFCQLQDKMEVDFPIGREGKKRIDEIVKKIKSNGADKKYDCVIGISGGRDSSFILYYAKKILGLRPIAVHFNDGFGNPVAGENMIKMCHKLGVELRTITSDWRESKDIRISFLKASTPDLEEGTDIGIASSLYGVATKENINYIIIGQSFRTEGIAPFRWNYLDGKYLKAVHSEYGALKLRKWHPTNPGFNLDLREMFYYTIVRRIRTIPILYYVDYNRCDVDKILKDKFDWVSPGAHYSDDLYQGLMTYVYRVKFGIDRRIYQYSALIRSNQMERKVALERVKTRYSIENTRIIDLCIKRLGLTKKEFQAILTKPPKTFLDYPNNWKFVVKCKTIIRVLSRLHILPVSTYDKYFNTGEK